MQQHQQLPKRRLALSFAFLALAALPALSAPTPPPPADSAGQAKAEALVKRAIEKAQQAKTLTAKLRSVSFLTGPAPGAAATVRFMKPNYARITVQSDTPTKPDGENPGDDGIPPGTEGIATGKEMILLDIRGKTYQRRTLQPGGAAVVDNSPLMALAGPGMGAFFDPQALPKLMRDEKYLYAGKSTRAGRQFDVIRSAKPGPPKTSSTLYFGPEGLLEGAEVRLGESAPMSWWLEEIKLDEPLKVEEFEYTPPPGFTEQKDEKPETDAKP